MLFDSIVKCVSPIGLVIPYWWMTFLDTSTCTVNGSIYTSVHFMNREECTIRTVHVLCINDLA